MKVALLLLCLVASACGFVTLGGRKKVEPEKIANFDELRQALVENFNHKFAQEKFFAFYEMEKMERQVSCS